jgi:hypothetical protein
MTKPNFERTRSCAIAFFAVVSLWLGPASAAQAQQIHGVRFEGHLDLALHGDPGIGARVDIPLVPGGLLDGAHDELAISPGVDLLINHGAWVGLPVALQWNFYLAQQWSVFPELGAVIFFGGNGGGRGNGKGNVGADILVAVGGRYHLNDRNALVLRIGWPFGLQFGVTF